MSHIALSYLAQQTEQQRKNVHTKKRTAQQQYDIKELTSESSGLKPLFASLSNNDNTYKILIYPQPPQNHTVLSSGSTLTVKDMVDKIKDTFGLNSVQVADIVRVSRPTLYNHMTDKETPKSLAAYRTFHDIAVKVDGMVNVPLKPGLKSILVNGKTLLAHLKSIHADPDQIIHAAVEVAKKLAESNKRSELSSTEQRKAARSMTKAGY
jgi:hypothetical protein